jgi:hypothetical protein
MLALWTVGTMSAALAAPPVNQREHMQARSLEPRPSLDLRAPAAAMLAAARTPEAFPSALHRQAIGERPEFELSGRENPQARIPGRIEEFGQRVRREGLPVARLWENKSALVHLGLNQKGKPGLWIVQKVH